MKPFIKVTFQQEGVHRWRDCPHEEVDFLRNWHRHVFHFEVEVSVNELDRDIEFILLKRELQAVVFNFLTNPIELSCEAMASHILSYLMTGYGRKRYYKVYVSEDGENGGGVIHEPSQ